MGELPVPLNTRLHRASRDSSQQDEQDPDPVEAGHQEPTLVKSEVLSARECGQGPDPVVSDEPERAVIQSERRTAMPHVLPPEQDPDPVVARGAAARPSKLEALSTMAETDAHLGVASEHSSKPEIEVREPLSPAEFSRYVPAAVRRAVWERDRGQCTFVGDQGNRCTERRFLEIDHLVAHARGGPTTAANCRLLCRAHNQHWARITFGADFVERARSRHHTGQSATR